MTKFSFDENNSGGSWWLDRKQYDALFAAGWKYEASEYDLKNGFDTRGFCGPDDVPYGWRHGLTAEFDSMRAAVESWERATGQDFFIEGCNCCGAPFSMRAQSGECLSGSSIERTPIRPW